MWYRYSKQSQKKIEPPLSSINCIDNARSRPIPLCFFCGEKWLDDFFFIIFQFVSFDTTFGLRFTLKIKIFYKSFIFIKTQKTLKYTD